ncbi:MAG: flagellar basal body rod protein FlgB [Campylobacterales bacterium]
MEISKAYNFMAAALNGRALRQDLIASNIANADTPFYRPRDLDFETVLAQEARKAFLGEKSQVLPMAKTNRMHLDPIKEESGKPTLFFRDGHLTRNDGNSVDIDVEMSEMSKNNVMYQALTSAIKKESAIMAAVIDATKSIQ